MTLSSLSSFTNPSSFDPSANARFLFKKLKELSFDGVGITRESYGASEEAAINLIRSIAERYGLGTETDEAANLFVTLPGESDRGSFVLCGSHLDSVPHGGNYDGAAGVIAGLVCLCKMKSLGILPQRPIKLVVLRGEESAWFGKPCVGSSALLGQLSPADLLLSHYLTGKTLIESMKKTGANTDRIQLFRPLVNPRIIAAYFELHIEQGPVLVRDAKPMAIVSGIRGNIRHKKVTCTGQAGHSGAVPQSLRHDAVLGIADLLMRLERRCKEMVQSGSDLVVTAGIIGTNPTDHAMTRIPGDAIFSLDIRSQEEKTLEDFYRFLLHETGEIEAERGVQFHFDPKSYGAPVVLSPAWIERLKALAWSMGLAVPVIPSGAGHDAAVFSAAGIPTAMIFVRNENGSHNPNEAMDMADFVLATHLLYDALLEAA